MQSVPVPGPLRRCTDPNGRSWPRCEALEGRRFLSTTLTTLYSFGVGQSVIPTAITVDPAGDVFATADDFSDASATGSLIEVMGSTHQVSTIATVSTPDNQTPEGTLVRDAEGNLYGWTLTHPMSNPFNQGAFDKIYEVPAGTHSLSTLLDVAGTESGSSGPSNFAADPGGNLYFTDGSTLYEVQGSTHTLATVDSLESAVGDLVFDQSGNLFGIAGGSGAGKYGTVAEVVAGTRQLRTLATFDKTNGVYPNSLVCDARGNLYGLTESIQGLAGATAFEVPAGSDSATTIASFGGSLSPNSLFVGPGGDLFGTTLQGGTFNEGALFEINPESRTLSTLYNFRTPTSANFSDLLFDDAGDIFGTLQNSVFEIAAGTHSFTVLEGTAPGQLTGDIASQLCADSAGNLYFAASASNLASTGAIFEMAGTGFVTSPSAPVVFTQPSAVETLAGRAASFTAVRNSTPAPSVQWQSSADGGKTFTNIAGNPTATTQTLTLSSVDRSQSGTEYRAVFTNSLGTTASNAATLSIVPMVVVTPAHASPNVVTSNSTTLTALGDSATGESGLTYTWRVVASPPGAPKPTFSADGTAAAGRSTVAFAKAGYYRFRCTISDGKGDTVASDVSVRVEQQAMSLRLSPHHSSVAIGQSITIHAAEYDQFGHPLQQQPAPTFTIESGPGTIDATTGVFSSTLIGTDLIEATDDDLSGTVGLQVIPS